MLFIIFFFYCCRRFELHKYLVGFPVRVISWLCLYYKIDLLGQSMWDRIDKLSSIGVFSKEAAKHLKLALSNIMELYVRTGEKKVVHIGTAIKEYNKQNPPYDSDEEENEEENKPKAAEEEEMEEENNFSSFEMEEGEEGATSPNPSKQKNNRVYILKNSDVEQIAQVYLVLIPLQNSIKEWIHEENKTGDKATLKHQELFCGSNSMLAEVYMRLCHYEKAKYYYRAAIQSEPENFQLLNSFGAMWNKLGNYKKAIKYYENAVIYIEKEHGEQAPQLATPFNNLAMANVNLDENLKAIYWLEKALEVDKKVYGSNHPHVARDYKNLGLMALKEKQYEKALNYLSKGLSMDRDHYSEISAQVAGYYNDLARVYQGMEKYSDALDYYEKALQVDKQLYADANAIIASRFLSMGSIYQKLLDFQQAFQFHEKALEIYSQVHGDDHLTVATTLYTTGIMAVELDQLEKALEFLKRSYASFMKIKGDSDSETLICKKKMKEIEDLLRQRQLQGDEYEKWKLLEEENRKKSADNISGLLEMEDGGMEETDEVEYVAPKIYGPDSVQQCDISVFEDDFYEL